MPHCTTNFVWYLGKFIIGFTGMLFLYVGFLKEDEKSYVCDARMGELLRQKNEKTQDACYPCGCNRMQDCNMVSTAATEYVDNNCARNHYRCCAQNDSY